ncbi:hypothetical protein FGO68_gene12586 [Halteria grandinella]|uniref:Uncharacterized protein n=1 Tax=Halteria grandinella TaxID=5974 RepID=A0A8J8P114_HALGN|nr:hypothetical protein FGO68_gene12586 [Halteria grandinella]
MCSKCSQFKYLFHQLQLYISDQIQGYQLINIHNNEFEGYLKVRARILFRQIRGASSQNNQQQSIPHNIRLKHHSEDQITTSADAFLKQAMNIIKKCDNLSQIIDKSAQSGKDQAAKVKTQAKQMVSHLEGKLTLVLKNERDISYGEREVQAFIMRNKDHMTTLNAEISSLESQFNLFEAKKLKRPSNRGPKIVSLPQQIKKMVTKDSQIVLENVELLDSLPRQQVKSAGYCEPFFAIFDDTQKKTIVYNANSKQKIVTCLGAQRLLTGNLDFFILDQQIYKADQSGQFKTISELNERAPVTCGTIISSKYLLIGLSQYTKISCYDISILPNPTLFKRTCLAMRRGQIKSWQVDAIQGSKHIDDIVFSAYNSSIVKFNLNELIQIPDQCVNDIQNLCETVFKNLGHSILDFRQIEDQYLAVLTENLCFVVDHFSHSIPFTICVRFMPRIFLAPSFSIDENPWMVGIKDGNLELSSLTGEQQIIKAGSKDHQYKEILYETETKSGKIYIALNSQGQIITFKLHN